jgi:hypothetical protein
MGANIKMRRIPIAEFAIAVVPGSA